MSVIRTGKLATATLLFLTIAAVQGCGGGSDSSEAPTVPAAQLAEVQVQGTTPMIAAAIDLSSVGYTEREFYAEGKGNRYRGAQDGKQATAEVIDGNWPYKTRVLVRAPQAAKFNGTLVVEWANVTLGQDVDFGFAESYKHLLREGYAVAVVSPQKMGGDRLKTWSPQRYGSLSVDVGNIDPVGGGNIDACGADATCAGDALSWDVLAQVSKALKENTGPNPPLPGMKVKHVIALGESQSAVRLTTYYNTIQPIHQFFDGFVHLDMAMQRRSDLSVPSVSVNSEVTVAMFPATTTSKFTRTWAVAGASHSSLYGANYVDNMVVRDQSFGGQSFSQLVAGPGCALTPFFSTVDSGLVLNAALESVNQWIRTGKEAAATREIQRDASGAVARDANGMALGGVRLAQFLAPTAFLAPNSPGVFCALNGHHRDYAPDELRARYSTHNAYVALVRGAMQQARSDGYILPFDEQEAITNAEVSSVAR